MRVVSVVSLKGGVGKTSLVLGLAGAAQASGRSVLVVDLDPQANASLVLGADRADFTTADVLRDASPGVLADAIQESSWDGVDVVPAELELESRATHRKRTPGALATAMDGLRGYDLVLIDCPPTLSTLTVAGLVAARRALLVVEPSLFSLVGTEKMLTAIGQIRKEHGVKLRPAGIVVNRMRRGSEQDYRLGELREAYPELLWEPTVPDRAVVLQAEGACQPVQQLSGAGAAELSGIYSGFLDRLLG